MPLGNPIQKQNNTRIVSATATAGQIQFTVTGGYTINAISVYRNGVRLSNADDFTASDGSTVSLNVAADVGDSLDFHIFDKFTVSNAIVSAASTQAISGNLNVTGSLYATTFRPDDIVTAGNANLGSLNVSGISTLGIATVSAIGLDLTGTANISGIASVGAAITMYGSSGIVSATSFYGDGSNLSGIDATTVKDSNGVTRLSGTTSGVVISGTTSGSSVVGVATFQNGLDITGNIVNGLNVSAGIATIAGDVSIADKIIHTGDTDTAIRFSGADTISFETGGSARAFINSAGDLTVGGSAGTLGKVYIRQASDTDTEGLALLNGGGSNSFKLFLGDTAGTVAHLGHGGQKQINITQAGKTGIGITNPGAELHAYHATSNTIAQFESGDAGAGVVLKDNSTYSSIEQNGTDFIISADQGASHASSALLFKVDTSEKFRIDSSGRLLVGTTASRSANSAQGSFQIEGTGAEDSDMSIIRNQANSGGPAIVLGKSRNASLAGNTVVQDGDQLGTIVFVGNDGTDLTSQGARIDAYVDGTPGSDDMPGRLVFSTTADGASSPTERLRIDSSGKVGIGTDTPDSVLGVQGAQGYADSASTLATSTTKSAFRVKGSNNSSDSLWMGVETVAANPYIQGANGNGSASKDLLLNPFGGDVGIGVTAAGLKLHIQDGALASAPTPNSNCDVVIEGTTNTGIQFLSSGQTQLRFGDAASTAAGAIIYEHSGDLLKLNYSNSGATTFNDGTGEVARFTPDGLTFNGDTAAANALDDYEEGTWTIALTAPTTNPSYTLTAGVCNYRKVGQIVHFTINLQFNSWSDGSGNLQWSLPFAARAGTSQWQGCGNIIYANGFESGAGDGGTYGCYVDPGASIFYVRKSDSNTSVVQATEMATSYSHHYIGYGTYVVD